MRACAILEDFFMLQSRRGFLIGAGAVLTTAFVKDARSFIHRNNQPPLSSPSASHVPASVWPYLGMKFD
jgi:hypothetical protein